MQKGKEMNILFFGPNGSGKGTQGAILQKEFNVQHVESGVIFRDNISKGTDLGKKAKQFIERGELVPDDITIPMILERLQQPDCAKGWLLDGFPRNVNQAKQLDAARQQVTETQAKLTAMEQELATRAAPAPSNQAPSNPAPATGDANAAPK